MIFSSVVAFSSWARRVQQSTTTMIETCDQFLIPLLSLPLLTLLPLLLSLLLLLLFLLLLLPPAVMPFVMRLP